MFSDWILHALDGIQIQSLKRMHAKICTILIISVFHKYIAVFFLYYAADRFATLLICVACAASTIPFLYSLVARQHTDTATLLHAGEVLLRLAHVRVDLVHALLDPVQLLCPHTHQQTLYNHPSRIKTCVKRLNFFSIVTR